MIERNPELEAAKEYIVATSQGKIIYQGTSIFVARLIVSSLRMCSNAPR